MKLYPLIYTNEAARSAEESLEKGVFAYLKPGTYPKVILISGDRLLQAIDSVKKKAGSTARRWRQAAVPLARKIAGRAVVGAVGYNKDSSGEDLYKVDTSAGVASFGPLAYQLAMYAIQPSWLMSDTSLKPASHRVWKNMYKLSEQGVYERKWLGDYNIDLIYERYFGTERGKFTRFLSSLPPPTEDLFIKWAKENHPEEPIENFGQFWAYRKTSHDPKIKNLFDQSEKFVEQMRTERKIPEVATREIIERSAALFFQRLYGSAASY
jgi:hypothetical protein